MQHWNSEDTMPVALYIWNGAKQVTRNARRKYREYTNLLDVLT
jgi:hypothetical protein